MAISKMACKNHRYLGDITTFEASKNLRYIAEYQVSKVWS
jgi:hypothetical protein